MLIQNELLLIALLASLACGLPGVFLVLRGMSLMTDAISHSILLGIILMFLWIQQLHSFFLLIGAAAMGLITVICVELLIATRCIKKDVAIGLLFPLFFSIGVLLITGYARNVHLDSDMVLLGEMAFAPFNRLLFYGIDFGPVAVWQLLLILILNISFMTLFYKELVISTFDTRYAQVLGMYPIIFHYALMSITSITAVGAFDAVGAIVVVALMIVPASTAFLLTKKVSTMIFLSAVFSILSSLLGFICAIEFDVSIAGAIASSAGLIFFIILIGSIFNKKEFTL